MAGGPRQNEGMTRQHACVHHLSCHFWCLALLILSLPIPTSELPVAWPDAPSSTRQDAVYAQQLQQLYLLAFNATSDELAQVGPAVLPVLPKRTCAAWDQAE